jgi:uncharacterized membrane protein/protein-disulfide isomerase
MKRKLARRTLWIIAILGILGFGLSIESYREFYRSVKGQGTWCSFSELSSCEKAFQSQYSVLFGRPISIYGAVAYFLVAAMALLGLANGGPYALASLFHLGLIAFPLLAATGYFSWALFTQVKTICILCVTDYLINLSIIILSWRACWKLRLPYRPLVAWDFRELFGTLKNIARTVLMVALLVVLGFLIIRVEHWYYLHTHKFDLVLENKVNRIDTPWVRSFPTTGPADAPIQVVIFGDYECPYCRMMKVVWAHIQKEYPDLVRMTAIAHPMNTDCNPMSLNNTSHPFACKAADLAIAVYTKKGNDTFWKIHNDLYRLGHDMSDESLKELGKLAGLSDEDLDEVWRKSRTREGLDLYLRIATVVDLPALPGTVINGVVVDGFIEEWALLKIIQAELGRKGLRLKDFRKK